jgi:hypothetical protein
MARKCWLEFFRYYSVPTFSTVKTEDMIIAEIQEEYKKALTTLFPKNMYTLKVVLGWVTQLTGNS